MRWPLTILLILVLTVLFGCVADRVVAQGEDFVNRDFFTFGLPVGW